MPLLAFLDHSSDQFQVADVVFKDDSKERKARNERHFSAAWYGKTSGFEVVHG
jgi:phenylalanyl-tRNA synthetase beta chain